MSKKNANTFVGKWHAITSRPLTEEEGKMYPDWCCMMEGLPGLGKYVLVTNGISVWVDSFVMYDRIYLEEAGGDPEEVTAWMELPEPYEEERDLNGGKK